MKIRRGIIVGAILGGLIGFLLRPSHDIMGQLPFGTVMSRGDNLEGLEKVATKTAETSFNYMLAGAIVGVITVNITRKLYERNTNDKI